jgi:hypothetical protein
VTVENLKKSRDPVMDGAGKAQIKRAKKRAYNRGCRKSMDKVSIENSTKKQRACNGCPKSMDKSNR